VADYTPYIANEDVTKTFTAGGTITGGDLVFQSAAGSVTSNGTVQSAAAATNLIVGVAGHDAINGARVTVLGGAGSVQELVSSAAIALGPVKSAATGRIAQYTDGTDPAGQLIGIALTTAAGAGTLCRVLFLR
jgi:hypothetical protein